MAGARILVIKHGALGDIVLAFPAFAAIRARHPAAHIVLLTTKPFAPLLAASPWFDAIETDSRPAWWDIPGLLALRARLRGFDLAYDLQTSARSSRYFRLAGRPPWSGIAQGCSFPHADPGRNALHTRERLAGQLAVAGIGPLPAPDLAWLDAPPPAALPARFIALVPGAAPHRPAKRWPAAQFGALAARLCMPAVVLGAAADAPLAAIIGAAAPGTVDLTGRTTLAALGAVLRRAAAAVGNDTGPMHLAASLGIPSLVLFSAESDPALTAPRYPDGGWPALIRVPDLAGLGVDEVAERLPAGQNAAP